jgi:hypothetical protein
MSPRRTLFGVALFAVAGVVAVAVLTLPLLYAVFGTDVPFMVNEAGQRGPASTAGRVKAAVLGGCCNAAALSVLMPALLRVLARQWVGIDAAGVWLLTGSRVRDGLSWDSIAAVSIVSPGAATTVPAESATPPFLELFPVAPAQADATPLGRRLVNAAPPRPGVRGKRHLIALPREAADSTPLLAAAVDRFAPGKRINGGRL